MYCKDQNPIHKRPARTSRLFHWKVQRVWHSRQKAHFLTWTVNRFQFRFTTGVPNLLRVANLASKGRRDCASKKAPAVHALPDGTLVVHVLICLEPSHFLYSTFYRIVPMVFISCTPSASMRREMPHDYSTSELGDATSFLSAFIFVYWINF